MIKKVEETAASEILKEIYDDFEIESNIITHKKFLQMIMSARLEYVDKKLKVNLIQPVKNDEGLEVLTLTFKPLIGQDLINAEKKGMGDMEEGMLYISAATNIPLGSIYKMQTRDIKNCQAVMTLFL